MKTAIVGIDGSKESLAAAAWTASAAASCNLRVVAVAVYGYTSAVAYSGPDATVGADLLDHWKEDCDAGMAGEWTAPLRTAGVDYLVEVLEGRPAEALIAAARRESADLIVVGSRGHGAVRELFLGSVSHELALKAPCAVVIIPSLVIHHASSQPSQPDKEAE